MENNAGRFHRVIALLVVFAILLSGLASAQGNSTSVYFPLVFRAEIVYPRITRISVASDGTQANRESQSHSISADGRYVAFESWASNLVNGDNNVNCEEYRQVWNCPDVFVHDRQTGETTLVSISLNWGQFFAGSGNPSISADGRYVAFEVGASEIFVKDRQTGDLTFISSYSWGQSISANGRYVAFASSATDLVSGDTNVDCYPYNTSFADNCPDVFVYDLQSGEIVRVSVASDGTQANGESGRYWYGNPSISADGQYIAFWSEASNLVSGDTNQTTDIFVHDRVSGETKRVSIASDGTQGNARSGSPSVSGDGRYVAFSSEASNLVSGDANGAWDIFVHDMQTGQTVRVSVSSNGTEGNGNSGWILGSEPSISANGRFVSFWSRASNLVGDDTNLLPDVFIHDLQTGQTGIISMASDGTQANGDSSLYWAWEPSISADGRFVAFQSNSSNLVSGDTQVCYFGGNCTDIFVSDRGD